MCDPRATERGRREQGGQAASTQAKGPGGTRVSEGTESAQVRVLREEELQFHPARNISSQHNER